jgi:D-xylose transport system ATP-binding protein
VARHGLAAEEPAVTSALVEMRHINKTFGGVHAVEDMSVDLHAGEVMGLLGHNGAGKSTLIKVLSGVLAPDSGEILINGERVEIQTPRDARRHGMETIYQNLALTDNLDAVANLFLGREMAGRFGFLDDEAMEHAATGTIARMKLRLPSLHALVSSLSGGQRQAVAIARAIHFDARVLIMDEPTAALGPEETRKVGLLIRELARQGIGIFLISHDIHDVFDLADRLTVMKNGRLVGTCRTQRVTKDQVLGMIISGGMPTLPADAAAASA